MSREPYLIAWTLDGHRALAQRVANFEHVERIVKAWKLASGEMNYQIGFLSTPSWLTYGGDLLSSLIAQTREGAMPSEITLEFVPSMPAKKPFGPMMKGSSKAEMAFQKFLVNRGDETAAMIMFHTSSSAASGAAGALRKAHPEGYAFGTRSCEYKGEKGTGVFVEVVGS